MSSNVRVYQFADGGAGRVSFDAPPVIPGGGKRGARPEVLVYRVAVPDGSRLEKAGRVSAVLVAGPGTGLTILSAGQVLERARQGKDGFSIIAE